MPGSAVPISAATFPGGAAMPGRAVLISTEVVLLRFPRLPSRSFFAYNTCMYVWSYSVMKHTSSRSSSALILAEILANRASSNHSRRPPDFHTGAQFTCRRAPVMYSASLHGADVRPNLEDFVYVWPQCQ